MLRSLRWDGDALVVLDQTALPAEERYLRCRTAADVADAIRSLKVRGAPAIGAAAAYGLALAARSAAADGAAAQRSALRRAAQDLLATRPTAVNLRWAVERVLAVADGLSDAPPDVLADRLLAEAQALAAADAASNRALAAHGAALIRPGERILTYCNTGSLATVDYGTALGILRAAHEQGKGIHVYVCETRPVLQGARLTAVEVLRDGIPATLITDNAAGWLMRTGRIDRVVVGADRIARNGDTANKIGTYTLAVLARAHEIPFIVAAPLSTVDFRTATGDAIPVEERRPEEITHIAGVPVAPPGMPAMNIAFDITPHHLISAIVTDVGVATPPYTRSLQELASSRPRQ
ncbi:MAG: S-methyl-5-thioribose-1-phosphate isomerase [Armatimonadota bacterium]|nr:S-methyl-5-thioribose-1-phosphate isomerase [Armatimonadota bacterium]MDR7436789.1 S-methyl-5-thioribose-1-phosphate isomerase [Armatimonadota bacterium]MDR7472736.1 S-methyl-5-thioribose-1-phosphate isomerase [Armatimonadota bacterium]MDR7506973.1 S-methyl-5-thioribose-1-phosphate isomerase [Armatimonadota bacterium]MDR7508834.1 S-methyl-5-thioribose-1-phosphate isomerase [Armatimonadota bacterium]